MTQPDQPTPNGRTYTSKVVASKGEQEVVLMLGEGKDNYGARPVYIDGFVQAHDGTGRLMFDAEGRPILLRAGDQKPHASTAVIALWIIAVLQVAAVIAGIVAAVALHDANSFGY